LTNSALVSVIIPCFNQGRFLAEAIESVLNQSYRRRETIVVDDGSTDDSWRIAKKFSRVELIRQPNSGLGAARNAGFRASGGDYLVFLDADDRLLSDALEIGINRLDAHPECAFTYGRYGLITEAGAPMPSAQRECGQGEPYLRLLSSNYIGMHATVMYRRAIFEALGGFNPSLAACEDYDMFLRITRNHPVYRHGEKVAEYRQHDSNMSRNVDLMLKHSIMVLRSQWKYARGNQRAREAYRAGLANWRNCYGKKLVDSVRSRFRAGQWRRAIEGAVVLAKYYPGELAHKAGRMLVRMSQSSRLFSITLSRPRER